MTDQKYFLGIDLGSSSVKVAIIDQSCHIVSQAQYPKEEMQIFSPMPGWAEQDPNTWYEYTILAINEAIQTKDINPSSIASIGIAYQMHGLVCIDKNSDLVRPSIIWCDSRAIEVGATATEKIGKENCFDHHLNAVGNFTAAKLGWVQQNEPHLFAKIDKIMLPGDYIAYRMSGEVLTSKSGLSEGIFWDFKNDSLSQSVLDSLNLSPDLIPPHTDSFKISSRTNVSLHQACGIPEGTPIAYRAGDQPNNALAMGVLDEGEAAGTGGTSGVVYAVSQNILPDTSSRVNTFLHVNNNESNKRLGTLLCINGTGVMYNWVRTNYFQKASYQELEAIASTVPMGASGVLAYSFGNGAERMLGNNNIGASFKGIDFNRHDKTHLLRATLEGIAYAFAYGLEAMAEMGIYVKSMRVGNDNLFQSKIFAQTLSNTAKLNIEVIETNGAIGAAIGGAFGAGLIDDLKSATRKAKQVGQFTPETTSENLELYKNWKSKINI